MNTKIKVFQYRVEFRFDEEKIEKEISDFIEDKDVIDIKVSSFSQSVSVSGSAYNKAIGCITIVYTVIYKDLPDDSPL